MPDFYSGATDRLGRFTEGFSLRRVHRPIFKCKACDHQFWVTSRTIFASRKLPVRAYLLAIAIFVNERPKAIALCSSLAISMCEYKTAFVMAHRIREALSAEGNTVETVPLSRGRWCYFGGYVKPANFKENRRDRRFAINQNGKRRVVVVIRERKGRTLPLSSRRSGRSPRSSISS